MVRRRMSFVVLTGALVVAALGGVSSPAVAAPGGAGTSSATLATYTGHRLDWSLVMSDYPNSPQWNSTVWDARVGFYPGAYGGSQRPLFRMDLSGVAGAAQVVSAQFVALETHSASCQRTAVQAWLTGPISEATTWANQPAWLVAADERSVAIGNEQVCNSPDGPVAFDVTAEVQQALAAGNPDITIGLRIPAAHERDLYFWKRFSNDPVLQITYEQPGA